jgi:hypothetical protein
MTKPPMAPPESEWVVECWVELVDATAAEFTVVRAAECAVVGAAECAVVGAAECAEVEVEVEVVEVEVGFEDAKFTGRFAA